MPLETRSADLSIVVPTFNESGNVGRLVELLNQALSGLNWEVIFVDDNSPDKTFEVVKAIGARDPRVRCIRRVGRRGLSGACIEGILSSSAPVVAVMDADLQHDETLLPRMYDEVSKGADLVVGSRYVDGGSSSQGLSAIRQWGSDLATRLARQLFHINLSDPMSGFFMVRREKVEAIAEKLSREGFKILLDIVATSPAPLRTVELPFVFRERQEGASKLDSLVTADYLGLLLSKMTGGLLPVRFLMFSVVGASGIFVHLASLYVLSFIVLLGFSWAQLGATLIAMTWNFILNNQLTYRDRRLSGFPFIVGLLTFYVVCSLGTLANVGVASWIFSYSPSQMLAGLAGAILGSVFNYAATSVLTWRK